MMRYDELVRPSIIYQRIPYNSKKYVQIKKNGFWLRRARVVA